MKKVLIRILLVILGAILILVANYFIFAIGTQKISEGTPIDSSGMDRTALLVIDIQEGTTGDISFTEGYLEQADELIGNTNRIIDSALACDWLVIYIQTEVVNPLVNLINNTLARGSEGAKLDKRLEVKSNFIVTKRKSDSFNNTDLDRILDENRVGKLVMTGLDAEGCVYSTIRAALNREYSVAVIPEAVIAKTDSVKIRMIGEYADIGVEIIHLDKP